MSTVKSKSLICGLFCSQKAPGFLLLLSFVEMWERFSYYGMRCLLVLYLVSSLGFADAHAYAVYTLFAAVGYAMPPLFGFLADRVFGARFVLKLGGVIMIAGHAMMGFSGSFEHLAFFGLAAIAVGTGAFKGNISNLLGACYKDNSEARSGGFSIFYAAINLGAFSASIICGFVGATYGFHWGFALAGIAMTMALSIFIMLENLLPKDALAAKSSNPTAGFYLISLTLISVWLIGIALQSPERFTSVLNVVGLVVLLLYFYIAYNAKKEDRNKLIMIAALCMVYCAFYGLEMHLGSLINLFTERNLDRSLLGYEIPAGTLQSLNPLSIMILGPMIAMLCPLNPKYLNRIVVGALLSTTLCFGVLYLGCSNADIDSKVGLWYLIVSMVIMSCGEVVIGPLIQSQVSWLAPKEHKGFVFGILMLSLAFANTLGGKVVQLMAVPQTTGQAVDRVVSLGIYSNGFKNIAIYNVPIAIVLGLGLFLLNKCIGFNLSKQAKQ